MYGRIGSKYLLLFVTRKVKILILGISYINRSRITYNLYSYTVVRLQSKYCDIKYNITLLKYCILEN